MVRNPSSLGMTDAADPGPGRADSRRTVFLLSPASCGGERARLLFNPAARFDLARALRLAPGVPLGEVFSFLSGLYFRGKLEYARTYARPPAAAPGVFVMTAGEGCAFRSGASRWRCSCAGPTWGSTSASRAIRGPCCATPAPLWPVSATSPATSFCSAASPRESTSTCCSRSSARGCCFPADFVGRGDMSRGGLLLRSARDRRELPYVPVSGSARRGARPARLRPRPGASTSR